MTEEERKMLRDLHRALLEPGADGDKPMIERMSTVVKAFEGGRTVWKVFAWCVAGILGLLTVSTWLPPAVAAIIAYFKGGSPS